MGTTQWTIKAGSAKNSKGQPIDQNGNVIANNNAASSGLVGGNITIAPSGAGYTVVIFPQNTGSFTITIGCGGDGEVGCPDDFDLNYTGTLYIDIGPGDAKTEN